MSNIDIISQVKKAKQAYLENTSYFNQDCNLKNNILSKISEKLLEHSNKIIASNKIDIDNAKASGLSEALIDRLIITNKNIEAMCASLDKIISLDDPCNRTLNEVQHRNGMLIKKISTPIGVIAIIYESRPNVTLDAAALCIKSGNAVVLKGGKEAVNTNRAIAECINLALSQSNCNSNIVQFVDSIDRQDTLNMLQQKEYIDIIIPRGGTGLINFVNDNTKIPVLKHLHGICHTYIDKDADLNMACDIIINAKCQRPGVCNAMETLLVHHDVAAKSLALLMPLFREHHVDLRVCDETLSVLRGIGHDDHIFNATEDDWTTEYLDLILSVKTVSSLEQAVQHINNFGSHHSDAIVSNNCASANYFLDAVDSAVVYHNASTRYTDGEEFGMGAEMGISTDKLHARGPVGLKELTTYKYKIYGTGQIRE